MEFQRFLRIFKPPLQQLTFREIHNFDIISIVWNLDLLFVISKVPTAIKFQGNAQESIESKQMSNTIIMFSTPMGLSTLASNAEPHSLKVYWLLMQARIYENHFMVFLTENMN